MLEGLGGPFIHELVVVELADRAPDVVRETVQLLELLLDDSLQHPPGALRRLVEPFGDPLPLAAKDIVQPLADIAEHVVQVVPLQLLQALLPESFEHLLEAGQPPTLAVAPAPAHQPMQGIVEVSALEEVFSQAVE